MNKVIKLKKGLDIAVSGTAAQEIGSICRPDVYSIVPDQFAGITPKLVVKEGESVLAGSPLFHDKQFTEMNFISPVSGKVIAVNRGERRKIMSIDIQADKQIVYKQFNCDLAQLSAEEIKSALLETGLWCLIKQRPYDCIALPNKTPKAIFISTFDTAPCAPNYEWVLKGHTADLQAAISALSKIATVYIGIRGGDKAIEFRELKDCTQYEVYGPHPAGNIGVQINHLAPVNKGESVWTINIQDLGIIGRLFTKGIVDMQRLVALTGPQVVTPRYYRVLPGMPISAVVKCNVYNDIPLRYVNGNLLSGHQTLPEEIIDAYCNQISVIDNGSNNHEFMGWLLPRFNEFNANHTDPAKIFDCKLSRWLFGKKEYKWDARLKGGRRAIIVSGEYDKVFPMDIYPEYLIKAMIAGNIDKMEALGAYEVAPEDFALCEYVCTSKMPLQAIVRTALDNLKKEIE